ncbi:hypothetical protein TRVL_08676 [Trypanosoma vivax]|uniref:Uncharacterized protein n=1 Tax=Trypanosoma vivax (strain Y486) TaxID=1055687 RepID=G0UA91_TRYVY|nr:hypothetical protein TRVL_08676 [Trypanosoma vivax]CCC52723.1 hypothetical protein TVY486_1102080 [Trypanosoma vivax Y486]
MHGCFGKVKSTRVEPSCMTEYGNVSTPDSVDRAPLPPTRTTNRKKPPFVTTECSPLEITCSSAFSCSPSIGFTDHSPMHSFERCAEPKTISYSAESRPFCVSPLQSLPPTTFASPVFRARGRKSAFNKRPQKLVPRGYTSPCLRGHRRVPSFCLQPETRKRAATVIITWWRKIKSLRSAVIKQKLAALLLQRIGRGHVARLKLYFMFHAGKHVSPLNLRKGISWNPLPILVKSPRDMRFELSKISYRFNSVSVLDEPSINPSGDTEKQNLSFSGDVRSGSETSRRMEGDRHTRVNVWNTFERKQDTLYSFSGSVSFSTIDTVGGPDCSAGSVSTLGSATASQDLWISSLCPHGVEHRPASESALQHPNASFSFNQAACDQSICDVGMGFVMGKHFGLPRLSVRAPRQQAGVDLDTSRGLFCCTIGTGAPSTP